MTTLAAVIALIILSPIIAAAALVPALTAIFDRWQARQERRWLDDYHQHIDKDQS